MKRVTSILFITTALAVLIAGSSFAASDEEKPSGHSLVVVSLNSEPDGITPNPAKVKLGDTVVFHNNAQGSATIAFVTRIGLACAAPVNFYADLLGNYETSRIAEGAIASICFIEPGTYEYEVKRLVTKPGQEPFEMISKGAIKAHK